MGNFRQHITCSTVTGVAFSGIAYHLGFSPPVCLVSAGLCSFAGMLPDIDSDTSRSFQECIYLAAGLGCVLFVQRLRHFGIDPDLVILGGVAMFLFIRFGVGSFIKKLTSHRGMIHSIPMAIFSGELTFFITTGTVQERCMKAAALVIGYLSHLILDEVYSIDSTGRKLRLKKSFGTALKWSDPKRKLPVILLYVLIFSFGYTAFTNYGVIDQFNERAEWVTEPVSSPEIIKAAAEFLQQKGTVAVPARAYSSAVTKPAETELTLFSRDLQPLAPLESASVPEVSELPPAMQIDSSINRDFLVKPAPIILP